MACGLHQQRKERAADRGSAVHDWIEQYLKTGIKPATPKDQQEAAGVVAFLKWERDHGVKFIASELLVYSKKHDFGGLMDAKAKIDGKVCAIDFKTSSGVYNEHRYQVAAYQAADMEEGSRPAINGDKHIIRLDKETGAFEPHVFGDQDADFSAFLGLLATAKREKTLQDEWRKENT